eukprot:gene2463-4782_t
MEESIAVLLHASLLGRTDIVQHAISTLRSNGSKSNEDVALLISSGRSPEDDATALHIAAYSGHADVVRALLNSGANPSALIKHAPKDSPNVAFLDKRPYEVAKDSSLQAFHVYFFEQIAMGNISKIEKLLQGGVPVELFDGSKLNDSTIHWACSFGNIEAARILCTYGINTNIRNNDGQTPLHIACKNGNKELIHLLLLQGSNSQEQDNSGKFPKDLLTKEDPEILNLLETVKPVADDKSITLLPNNSNISNIEKSSNSISNIDHRVHNNESHNINNSNNSYENNNNNNTNPLNHDKIAQFILWPPPQRQYNISSDPLIFSTAHILLISISSYCTTNTNSNDNSNSNSNDTIYPLLNGSGLIEVLQYLGLQVQVKRSATGSNIRFTIDNTLCTRRNGFELLIRNSGIYITACDSTGLLYSIYALIQIFQLHSEKYINNNNNSSSSNHNIYDVSVPCIGVIDWPDIPNRGIMWSYRHHFRTSPAVTHRMIESFSRVRINQLYLIIDTNSNDNNNDSNGNDLEDNFELNCQMWSPRIVAIEDECRRNKIDLIPTLLLTNPSQSAVMEILNNLSSKIICIIFQFDNPEQIQSKTSATTTTTTSTAAYIHGCIMCCKRVFAAVLQAGFRSVLMAQSHWMMSLTYNMNIWELATELSLHVKETSIASLYPQPLLHRTFLSQDYFIDSMVHHMIEVSYEGSTDCVLPVHSSADFAYPLISSLLQVFLYGGMSWNRSSMLDLLYENSDGDEHVDTQTQTQTPNVPRSNHNNTVTVPVVTHPPPHFARRDFSLLSELATLMMYPHQSDKEFAAVTAIFAMLTGSPSPTPTTTATATTGTLPNRPSHHVTQHTPGHAPLPSPPVTGEGAAAVSATTVVSSLVTTTSGPELARTEMFLWGLFMSNSPVHQAPVPSRSELSECLRHYRRLLLSVGWRVASSSSGSSGSEKKSGSTTTTAGSTAVPPMEEPEFDLHTDEFFATVHLLSVICKAIILAYNAVEKEQIKLKKTVNLDHLTLGTLMSSLQAGTKSDLANALLEALEYCARLWRRRYDHLQFTTSDTTTTTSSSMDGPCTVDSSSSSLSNMNQNILSADPALNLLNLFLKQNSLTLAGSQVFRIITEKLPISVEEMLMKVFMSNGPATDDAAAASTDS